MKQLTRKQQQILDFILKWQRTQGATPTYQEIADQFGFRSLNSVTGHVRLLRQKGYLESEPRKARAFRVISPLAKLRNRIMDIPLFGATPTYQEIADQFGFRSLNSVTGHVRLLRQKGYLESEPRKARAFRVISPLAKLRN